MRRDSIQKDKTLTIRLDQKTLHQLEAQAIAEHKSISYIARRKLASTENARYLDLDNATRIEQTMEGVQEAIFNLENHMDVLKRQLDAIKQSL